MKTPNATPGSKKMTPNNCKGYTRSLERTADIASWPVRDRTPKRCIWRTDGNIHAPQCEAIVDSVNRNARCCWRHSAAYQYLKTDVKAALREAAQQ